MIKSKKQIAIELRKNGKSIKYISENVGVSKSTAYLWTKDIKLSADLKKQIQQNGLLHRSNNIKNKKKDRISKSIAPCTANKFDKNYNPKAIGDKSVGKILSVFLDSDKIVLFPFGDKERYDLVVDENGDFIRVQCKTAQHYHDVFKFSTASTNPYNGKRKSYKGSIDVFAVFLRELNNVYIYNADNCPDRECTTRLIECRQKARIRSAGDHIFIPKKSLRDYC